MPRAARGNRGLLSARLRPRYRARRIIVTAGASAALLLACAALVENGAEVLMPDPCYPCNRHFVAAFDGVAAHDPQRPRGSVSS